MLNIYTVSFFGHRSVERAFATASSPSSLDLPYTLTNSFKMSLLAVCIDRIIFIFHKNDLTDADTE